LQDQHFINKVMETKGRLNGRTYCVLLYISVLLPPLVKIPSPSAGRKKS